MPEPEPQPEAIDTRPSPPSPETASTRPTAERRWGGYADYGCRVNAISVEELFERYSRTRFLYPDKLARLAPHMAEVSDNWRRGLRGGELIHWIATYEDQRTGGWASISSWRSTPTGWQTQHLVSTGGPVASRAVMLASQAVRIADGQDSSHQNWFRRSNRFAAAVFGTFIASAGADQAALIDYEMLALPRSLPVPVDGHAAVLIEHGDIDRAVTLAQLARRLSQPCEGRQAQHYSRRMQK